MRKAISELAAVAADGGLAGCARWLLDSRLAFLTKRTGPAPRPVRVGEFWRRVICKKMVHNTQNEAQILFLRLRQYGIAASGGADVLENFTGVLGKFFWKRGVALFLPALSFNSKNAFRSFECGSIREAVNKYMPKLKGWTTHRHDQAALVYLLGWSKNLRETIITKRAAGLSF